MITRGFIRGLAHEYGLGVRILDAGFGWDAELTRSPDGTREVGELAVLQYQSWDDSFHSGNGVPLPAIEVRHYLDRMTGRDPEPAAPFALD
jgi:hypothetical protein